VSRWKPEKYPHGKRAAFGVFRHVSSLYAVVNQLVLIDSKVSASGNEWSGVV
jgi:hypothetical protein